MFEKNIALALYNRGQYDEAVEYFDKALPYYWGKLPKHEISAKIRFLSVFFHFIIALYLPSLKFRKTPTLRDAEFIDLSYKKCKALAIINPKRFFIESLYICEGVTNFDLTKFELGMEIFIGASALFSFTGISFRLSRKILDSAKGRVCKDDVKESITYELLETVHNYFQGNWKAIKEYDDDLVKKNLSIGEIYFATQHLFWHGLSTIYRGSLDTAESIVNRLRDIFEIYENDFSLAVKYELNTDLLMEYRKLHDAVLEVEAAIDFAQKAGFGVSLFEMYSCKAWIHILMGDLEEAENSLQHANEIRSEDNATPVQLSHFYRSQLEYYLYRLNESIKNGNKLESLKYKRKAGKSGRKLLKVSKKAAQHRIESYKLTGVYFWLIEKQNKAIKWWHKAIDEGERIGARLELSRAYFEVGKHLLEAESKHDMLNGIKAEGYLEKARILFEDMDLQWDLDELGRVTHGR